MKIAIRFGHQTTGSDGGADGYIRETDVNRRYGALVISKLQSLGHIVINVTPPEANRTLSDSLYYGINMAKNNIVDLFVSCHVNASDYTNLPMGCEVVCNGSGQSLTYATNITNELANIGFKNRGAKADERGLAEIRNMNPCCIVEPFFLDSKADVDLYNKVGDEGIANAIVKGITGKTISTTINYNIEEIDFMFSERFYLQQNPDVKAAIDKGIIKNALQHYIENGKKEGRRPVPILPTNFNEGIYLKLNVDVANAVTKNLFSSGAEHYLLNGFAENRKYS